MNPPSNKIFDPRWAIIPIVEKNSNREIIKFLGTGFYVGQKDIPVVVTAKHLFNYQMDLNNSYGMVCFGEGGKKYVADVCGLKLCTDFDIAAFHSSLYFPETIHYKLSRDITPLNDDVFAFEYSPTIPICTKDGKTEIFLDAFMHKGNIMRYYISDFPESIPTPSFDTSFPALRGASGAPVIRAKDHAVAGMLLANHARHLVPAEIEKIQHDDKLLEETRYYLPMGKAIASSIIIDFLESIGENPEIVESKKMFF